jgi:hypothetical protein
MVMAAVPVYLLAGWSRAFVMGSEEWKIELAVHPFVALKHKRVLSDKGSNRVDWHHEKDLMPGASTLEIRIIYIYEIVTDLTLF